MCASDDSAEAVPQLTADLSSSGEELNRKLPAEASELGAAEQRPSGSGAAGAALAVSDAGAASEERPQLHRLFIGSVPRTAVEATLRGYFDQCGQVWDLAILRDRSSGKSRGCAFVSYLQLEEAEEAIARFDRQLVLPGAQAPLEVRHAKNANYVQAGSGPSDNRQLFFSRVPLHLKEEDLLPLFTAHGEVESIHVFKCRRSGRSKGCGFVEMHTRDAALMAMEQLDEQHVFDATGTAMSVRWADPELQDRKKKAMDEANLDNRMLFFAKVLRSTTEEEVRRLFTRFGKVHDVNLFRAFQGAPTTKGCGLVTMSQHAEAVLAIATLDGKYVWEGMDCPMVVKLSPPPRRLDPQWMDTALQRRRREQHLATIRQPLPSASIGGLLGGSRSVDQMSYQPAPSMPPLSAQALGGPGPSSTLVASSVQQQGGSGLGGGNQGLGGLMGNAGLMGRSGLMGGVSMGGLGGVGVSVPVGVGLGGGLGGSGLMNASGLMGGLGGGLGMPGLEGSALAGEPTETPPLGCNADAIKLFVGNIPKSCTEEQLLPLFQSIGKVVELVIVYDKVTHESKGSAFVWYATRTDAERAIIQFNLRHIFPDPTGAQDRPLVVRRAKARSRGPGAPGVLGGALGQPGLPMPYYQRMVGGVGMMGGVGLMPQGVAGLGGGMEALSLGGEGGGMGMMGGMQGVTVLGGGGDGGGAGHQGHRYIRMGGGQYDAYGAGDQLLNDYGGGGGGGYAVLQPAGGGGGMMGGAGAGQQWEAAGLGGQGLAAQAALSLSLNQQQLNAVHHHLFSLQTVSGAQLTLSASASPGLFNLVIAGGKAQVESARQLVERLAMV